jgi:hypothetical protein
MSGGPSGSGLSSRGKLVFGVIGGFAVTVLAVGLVGEFGKRHGAPAAAPGPGATQQAAVLPPAAPAKTDSQPTSAPVRTAQRETPPPGERDTSPRAAGTRPLAIGGPPSPDQFKPAETSAAGQSSARGDAAPGSKTEQAAASLAATDVHSGSRKIRVIEIPRPSVEESKIEPISPPAEETVAETAPAGSPAVQQAEESAGPSSDDAGRKLAAAPSTLAEVSGGQPAQPDADVPLPPLRPPFAQASRADSDEGETTWRSPHPLRTSGQNLEAAAPAARAQPRPPFKPEPAAPAQNTRQAAVPAQPAVRPVVAASPARPVRTEPIPNLDRVYRQVQAERQAAQQAPRQPAPSVDRAYRPPAERQAAIREPAARRARVAIGQERRPAAPRQAERAAPGQRLVAMHLRTYQGPDGETFDVLYRRRPADPPRSYASGSGSSRDGVLDWLNR